MKIIVPTDFSKRSITAYKFAIELAVETFSDVEVVHAIHLPILPETTFGIQPPIVSSSLIRQLKSHADASFEKLSEKCPTTAKVVFSTEVDKVVPAILSCLKRTKADFVVMSPSGKGTDMTVIQNLIRRSSVPVMSIPFDVSPSSIKSIVLATDLPLNQKHFMDGIKALCKVFDARLHIVFINSPALFLNSIDSTERFDQFVKHYHLTDCTTNVRNNLSTIDGIKDFVKEIKGDLLVMGTHGRMGISHFLNGSVAEDTVEVFSFPIWIAPMHQ